MALPKDQHVWKPQAWKNGEWVPLDTAEEVSNALWEWAESHRRGIPPLSDYAVSREAMYSRDEDDDGPR